ncbi:MAG: c-type cytochrome [Methyloglobulus sp.]|nr:cytochrome c4 [Methyloglobulus sp.]
MNKNLLALFLTPVLALAFSGAMPVVHAEDSVAAGNSASGKNKAATCLGCHGEDGNSMIPTYPKLAQQHSSYLVKQLQEFKAGTRNNAVMGPMAMALSEADMRDIGAYFAEQKITANSAPSLPPPEDEDAVVDENKNKKTMQELLAKGSNLYRNGNLASEVSACIACHGPQGEGNKPAVFPALHSQHADYLIQALTDFKSGARSNNPENMMHMIAKKMTDAEIKAVGYYISTMK